MAIRRTTRLLAHAPNIHVVRPKLSSPHLFLCLPSPPHTRRPPQFYEHDLRSQMLNQAFNTKPYNDFDGASFLIHYHGPKPHEYLSFLETGKCDFYSVCEQGFLR